MIKPFEKRVVPSTFEGFFPGHSNLKLRKIRNDELTKIFHQPTPKALL